MALGFKFSVSVLGIKDSRMLLSSLVEFDKGMYMAQKAQLETGKPGFKDFAIHYT